MAKLKIHEEAMSYPSWDNARKKQKNEAKTVLTNGKETNH